MSAHSPRFATLVVAALAAGLAVVAAPARSAAPASKSAPSGKSIAYRWVDEQGVVHYGDSVPPQYSQQEHSILNPQGVEVRRTDAQKTPEQISVETRQQEQIQRTKQHDSFLTTTYTSVRDIEALRDERLTQLHAQRTAAEAYVDNLHSRLSDLQTRAMNFRPYNPKPGARRMPDDLAEDLVRTLNEMRTQSNAIVAKGEQEATLKSAFQADIERYRELHSAQPHR